MMADNSILCESPIKYVEWRIHNFFEQPTPDFTLNSALFYLSGASWFLNTFTNDETDYSSSGWIGLVLLRKKTTLNHRVACRIGIKKSNGSEFRAMNFEGIYCETANRWGSDHFIEKSKLVDSVDDVAPDGTLTVFCTLRIMNMPCTLSARVETASQTISDDVFASSLSKDLKNIYINRRCTDVTLIVGNETFCAHRAILVARSSVFASMFEHNLSEKRSGEVEISDCDPDSFEEFLFFLYTGKLNDVPLEKAINLYKTADKYDIEEIKEECVHIMRHDLSADDFCDITHLAMRHRESELLKDATSFFIENAETILSTTKWADFLDENPLICNELLLKLVKSKK